VVDADSQPGRTTAIMVGSDDTQMMIGSDGFLYAKKGVSAGG
jgi:hypothetical protein